MSPGPTAQSSRPSRASSIASVDTSASSLNASANNNAALLGASLAFGRSAPRSPAPPPSAANTTKQTPSVSNGALAAASSVGTAGRSVSPSPQSRTASRSPLPMPGSHAGNSRLVKQDTANMDLSKVSTLAPPPQRPPHVRSPSQQAAFLATSRNTPQLAGSATATSTSERPAPTPSRPRTGIPTSDRPPVAPKPRRLSTHQTSSPALPIDKPTDTTSIPPTTSLVDLFEQRSKITAAQGKKPQPVVIKPSDDLPIRSPKPVRSGITSMFQLELADKAKGKGKARAQPDTSTVDPVKRPPPEIRTHDGNSSEDSFASASEDLNPRSPSMSPTAAAPGRHSNATSPSPGQTLKAQTDAKRRPAVSPSPLRQSASKPIEIQPPKRVGTSNSDALSVSSSHSLKTIPAQFHHAYPRRMTPLSTGDDLANAIVASSLASSRAPSPTRSEAPPVPTRRKKGHHHALSFSRTPSPCKAGMLRTLRKQDESSASSDEEDAQHPYGHHRKRRLVRKHPNKHHEGDRKRWRDAVTERERKRYEGVWAANKGFHYSFTVEEQELMRTAPNHQRTKELKMAVNDQVSNIVVRDIWSRSRLPSNVLETVWDLVDHDMVGRLNKEEFVVGMWLIDQRLKGRKLPVKVTDSVWMSVRAIHGIKVRK